MPFPEKFMITGAGGFIGQQAVEKALAAGSQVIAVVRPHDEDGRAEAPKLAELRHKYGDKLTIETVDLAQPDAVDALVARHADVTGILHAAAMMQIDYDEAAKAAAHRINVEATQRLALACEKLAATQSRTIPFHAISSDQALLFEQNPSAIETSAFKDTVTYGSNKHEAAHWLQDHQANELPHLDITVTYPCGMIGTTPSAGIVTRLLRLAKTPEDGRLRNMRVEYEKMNLAPISGRQVDLVRSDNFIQDVAASFAIEPKPGFREYSITPDYHMTLGELVQQVGEVIDAKRDYQGPMATPGAWSTMAAKKTTYQLRDLPRPPHPHTKMELRDVLSAQYDAIQPGLGR